jgi:glutaredoxin
LRGSSTPPWRRPTTVKLRVFTLPNCPKCPAAKRLAEAVAIRHADVTLEVHDMSDIDHMTTALMLQISSTPSFAIDETPIFFGELPSEEQLVARIEEFRRRV